MIDILVPTCNNLKYLQRAIETLVDYTILYEPYRIFVVDASDNELTAGYMKKYTDAGHVCIRLPVNHGFVGNVNAGLEFINSKSSILLLNDDVQITDPLWLHRMSQLLKSKSNIGAVGPVSNYVAGLQSITHSVELPLQHETNLLSGFCMLLRNSAYAKVGLLDPVFEGIQFDDFDYSIRLRELGYELWVERDAFVFHYGSISFNASKKEPLSDILSRGEQAIIRKWGSEKWAFYSQLPESLVKGLQGK